MNEFTKQWITSTLAPESIQNIKSDNIKNNYLDCITNESKTIKIFILSNDKQVQAIGKDYNELLLSKQYSFNEALNKIVELLELTTYNV